MREERILSQIRYAHPANTQTWRARAIRVTERIDAALQSAVLCGPSAVLPQGGKAAMNGTAAAPVSKNFGESASWNGAIGISLVETQILSKDQELTFDPVQVADFSEIENEAVLSTVSAVCTLPEDWHECTYVVGKTIEPGFSCSPVLKRRNEKETFHEVPKNFTVESLLESEELRRTENGNVRGNVPIGESETSEFREGERLRSPFDRDFEEEPDAEIFCEVSDLMSRPNVMEIPAEFSILLGRCRFPISEILGWKVGTVLNLGQKLEESAEVFVNGGCAGRGFPVECENRVGVRLCSPVPERF